MDIAIVSQHKVSGLTKYVKVYKEAEQLEQTQQVSHTLSVKVKVKALANESGGYCTENEIGIEIEGKM